MSDVTLTEFLLARIEDDKQEASVMLRRYAEGADVSAARWRRVRVECEAKRRIVELHSDDHECSTFDRNGERNNCTWVIGDDCSTMRLLALPCADHADYRDEWRL